jgi:hypothetical protein
VDTPRGQGMFGSLVVCLPQQHTGGELLVRHKGEEQRFGFAAASSNTVQWAAFYSDCEHEILPVQSGYRITLTYNLYAAASTQLDGPHLPGLDSSNLKLYDVLARALSLPEFLPDGGELAVPCEHVYPHTHEELLENLPAALKGEDALYYKVLQQLGLDPQLQAVHDFRDQYDRMCYGIEMDGGEGWRRGKRTMIDKTMQVTNLMALKMPLYAKQDGWDIKDFVEEEYDNARPLYNAVWLKDKDELKYQAQVMMGAYGNEVCTEAVYSAAAVFAEIPAWGTEGRAQLVKELSQA